MRVRVLTIGLALAIGCGSVGCKSAPKTSWWKTADKSVPTSTTVAQGAPQLPSEIAKQAEGLASAGTVEITTDPAATNTAPAYTATTTAPAYTAPAYTATNTAASPYPSTGTEGFVPSAGAVSSPPVTANVNTTASAKSALPYDPTAVPAVSTAMAATAPAAAPAQSDRYGMTSEDRYADAYPTTTAPSYAPSSTPGSATAYSTSVSGTPAATESLASTPATSSVPFASYPGSTSMGDRYATQTTPVTSSIIATAPSYSPPVQTASAVAGVQPYRPGGTSSYPGTSASYEVATRPDNGATNTTVPSYPTQGSTQYR